MKKMEAVFTVPTLKPTPLNGAPNSVQTLSADKAFLQDRYAYYIVKRREKLKDIALKLPGISVETLEHLNQLSRSKMLPPGSVVKIKQL